MSKSKKVHRKFDPQAKKPGTTKKNEQAIENFPNHPPVWQLKMIDMDHEHWGWKNLNEDLYEVLDKLKNYETRTWKEIQSDKKRDHPVAFEKLANEAQKRIKELRYDDIDELYRFKLSGKKRVWGIVHGYIFKILWWDPEHTVCPSPKKNT